MKIAAIILNYNSLNDTLKCISYLKHQTKQRVSIYVVDNNSSEKINFNKLEDLQINNEICLIKNNINKGYSAGNNIGLRKAVQEGADWCMIINPDVEIRDANYLYDAINSLQEYPDAVVIGTNVLLPTGVRQNPSRELRYSEELLWPIESLLNLLKHKQYLSRKDTGYCTKISGCCFLINSNFLNDIGYFDEHTFLYCEESILSKQVQQYGKKILYINEITAYHQHYPQQKGNTPERMLRLLDSRVYYLKTYSGYSHIKLKLLLFSKYIQRRSWLIRMKAEDRECRRKKA